MTMTLTKVLETVTSGAQATMTSTGSSWSAGEWAAWINKSWVAAGSPKLGTAVSGALASGGYVTVSLEEGSKVVPAVPGPIEAENMWTHLLSAAVLHPAVAGYESPTVRQTAVQVLEQASDLLAARGWVQGNWRGPGGGMCCLQALRMAADNLVSCGGSCCLDKAGVPVELSRLGLGAAHARLQKVIGTSSVPMWNDAPGQSVEDVQLALKRAAAL